MPKTQGTQTQDPGDLSTPDIKDILSDAAQAAKAAKYIAKAGVLGQFLGAEHRITV